MDWRDAGEYYHGYEEVYSGLLKLSDIPRYIITNQEYHLIYHNTLTCTVAGTYVGYTTLENQEIFSARQRVTFLWAEEGHSLKILHIHISNPLELQEAGENPPHKAGSLTCQYMRKPLEENISAGPLKFRGENAEIYFQVR